MVGLTKKLTKLAKQIDENIKQLRHMIAAVVEAAAAAEAAVAPLMWCIENSTLFYCGQLNL